jgi:hypothetical protein
MHDRPAGARLFRIQPACFLQPQALHSCSAGNKASASVFPIIDNTLGEGAAEFARNTGTCLDEQACVVLQLVPVESADEPTIAIEPIGSFRLSNMGTATARKPLWSPFRLNAAPVSCISTRLRRFPRPPIRRAEGVHLAPRGSQRIALT